MILFPNAKINLGLHVTGKRNDGFHNLETVLYPIDLCDVLEFIPREQTGMEFTASGISMDADGHDNLCVKAYQMLADKYPLPGIEAHLRKVIPIGGGLGGGSADAAFMLKGLNDYFNLNIAHENLKDMSATLGSDCPFFIDNEPAIATGRGEKLKPVLMGLRWLSVVVVYPDIHIPTREAYAAITPGKPKYELRKVVEGSFLAWKDKLVNDFEKPVMRKYPEIGDIKNKLYDLGAIYAAMSGSGSAVYGLFDEMPEDDMKWPEGYVVWSGKLR